MFRTRTACVITTALLSMQGCSLIIDTNPDGVIRDVKAGGSAGKTAGSSTTAGASQGDGTTPGGSDSTTSVSGGVAGTGVLSGGNAGSGDANPGGGSPSGGVVGTSSAGNGSTDLGAVGGATSGGSNGTSGSSLAGSGGGTSFGGTANNLGGAMTTAAGASGASTVGCNKDADCTSGPTGTTGKCSASTCTYSCNTTSYRACGATCILPAPTQCCVDGECPASAPVCGVNHACEKKGAGVTCSASTECATTICLDGHCCNRSSCGSCQACTSANGECLPVLNADDPDSCLGLKMCNDLGACIERFREYRATSEPRRIVTGQDGALWYTYQGATAGGVARLVPSGDQSTFPRTVAAIPGGLAPGAGGVNVWFTFWSSGQVSSVDTSLFAKDVPVGSGPSGVVVGPGGALWITDVGQPPRGSARVLRVSTAGTELAAFTLPSGEYVSEWVVVGSDGNIWFTDATSGRVSRITTALEYTSFALSSSTSQPMGICVGPEGALWFTETAAGKIGRITTTGSITEFALPSTNCGPQGITLGPDGALWFTENLANKIGRITVTGTVTEFDIPTLDSRPIDITLGSDGNLWFTESATWNIGRFIPPK